MPRSIPRRLSLAQAVHNSARFPYVSPGAMVLGAPGPGPPGGDPVEMGRLGDGGYHEVRGCDAGRSARTARGGEVAAQAARQERPVGVRAAGWGDSGAGEACAAPSPVVALILDSAPSSFPADYVRGTGWPATGGTAGRGAGQHAAAEVLAPVFGGLSTRTQLSLLSQCRLSRLVGNDPRR